MSCVQPQVLYPRPIALFSSPARAALLVFSRQPPAWRCRCGDIRASSWSPASARVFGSGLAYRDARPPPHPKRPVSPMLPCSHAVARDAKPGLARPPSLSPRAPSNRCRWREKRMGVAWPSPVPSFLHIASCLAGEKDTRKSGQHAPDLPCCIARPVPPKQAPGRLRVLWVYCGVCADGADLSPAEERPPPDFGFLDDLRRQAQAWRQNGVPLDFHDDIIDDLVDSLSVTAEREQDAA